MKPSKIIAIEADVSIAAAEGESKGPRKFDVLAYTGAALELSGWDAPVVVDLAGMKPGKSLVANLDHQPAKRVGHVTAQENDGKTLRLSGVVSAATESAREVVQSADAGFVWQASIEAKPTRIAEISAGKDVEVNGQTFTGPLYVVRASSLKGFAFVSHGADDNTAVTIAAQAVSTGVRKMKPEIKAWAEGMGIDIDNASDDQIAAIEVNWEGRNASPAKTKPKTKLEDVLAAAKAEQERCERIAEIAGEAIAGNPGQLDAIQALAELAERSKWQSDKFELELLRATRPQGHTVMRPRRDERLTGKVLEAALCQTGRMPNLDAKFSDQELQFAQDKFKNGVGLKQLYRICAKANGYQGDDDEVSLEMHRYACGLVPGRGREIQATGWSTLSIPGILGNVANKFLLEGWGGGEQVWRAITDIGSVRDFKQTTAYKLSGSLKYEKVGAGGEIKHGTVTEDSYTNQADTYGKMFAVTRTDIINDDLGAVTRIPMELGYGANDAFNEVFWTEFLDNSAFFASGNKNQSTGVFSTLATTIPSLVAAEAIWMAQTKPNGQPLGMLPTIILVPPLSYRPALSAMQSTLVVGTAGPTPDANTFRGAYAVYTSPYLANTAYTGYSTIIWYLLANRPGFSTMETVFLNGRDTPIVETAEADFNVLGMVMRGYHDFGCNKMEYRAGVQGSGA